MKNIERYNEKIFESIKHIDEEGNEYWLARDLQHILEYKDWRNFKKVISKAIIAAKNSYSNQDVWGVEVNTPINSGKGKEVRNSIKKLGSTLPEDLPTPNKSIKELENKNV